MKVWKWALPGLIAAVSLAGCKGFWNSLPSGGGGGGGSASGVFYIVSGTKVIGYSIASGATTPTAVTSGSVTFTAVPQAMAVSPNGSFLYVSAGGIFVYAIGTGGTLTAVDNGSNGNISSDNPTAMAVDGTGTLLVESQSGTGVLGAIPISSSTGGVDSTRTVQTASPNLPSTTLTQMAVSPSNSTNPYVFVAMGSGGTEVIPFTAGSTGNPFGTAQNIAVVNSSGGANAIAVDPTNRLLYVGESAAVSGTQSGGLRVFTIGTKVSEVTGSPYASQGTGPKAILPTSDGNFVYVANISASSGNIAEYPIATSGGAYSLGTLIGTISTGKSTYGMAEDNTHTYVIAVNSVGSPDLSTYTFDTTTSGKLVAGQTVSNSLNPTAIVAVP